MPTVIASFFDDFNSGTIDTSKWDTSQLQYARVEDGHLYFDTPVNETVPWVDYRLEAEMSSETISRIMYTIKLDSPPGPNTGWLLLGTSCGNAPGWMGASVGGSDGRFVAVYAPEGDDNGETIFFESVADTRSHTIDLRWVGDSVQVYLDRQLQDKQIPCEGPAWYAQFGAGLNRGTQVRGYFDDICIWP